MIVVSVSTNDSGDTVVLVENTSFLESLRSGDQNEDPEDVTCRRHQGMG